MYCNHCGANQPDHAVFCSQCGAKLQTQSESTVPSEQEIDKEQTPVDYLDQLRSDQSSNHTDSEPTLPIANKPIHRAEPASSTVSLPPSGSPPYRSTSPARHLTWIIPTVLLLGIAGTLFWWYQHQQDINVQVTQLHQEASQLALKGQYEPALAKITQATTLRPTYAVLTKDQTMIETANRIHTKLGTVSSNLKQNQLQPAEKSLITLQKTLDTRKESIFEQEKTLANRNQDLLAVLKVKKELDQLDTIDALAYKLDEVDRLNNQEAKEVHQLIINKIITISMKNAEKLLQQNDFSQATAAVKAGLQYSSKDEKLLFLQKRITSEKEAFELAEKQRIERAIQQAEEEDLKNRTAGVELLNVDTQLNEYGDIEIYGEVKNVATKPIYSITVYYSGYDAAGNYLFSSSASVEPYDLEPGATGSYSAYEYDWYEEVTVQIDNITWYLE